MNNTHWEKQIKLNAVIYNQHVIVRVQIAIFGSQKINLTGCSLNREDLWRRKKRSVSYYTSGRCMQGEFSPTTLRSTSPMCAHWRQTFVHSPAAVGGCGGGGERWTRYKNTKSCSWTSSHRATGARSRVVSWATSTSRIRRTSWGSTRVKPRQVSVQQLRGLFWYNLGAAQTTASVAVNRNWNWSSTSREAVPPLHLVWQRASFSSSGAASMLHLLPLITLAIFPQWIWSFAFSQSNASRTSHHACSSCTLDKQHLFLHCFRIPASPHQKPSVLSTKQDPKLRYASDQTVEPHLLLRWTVRPSNSWSTSLKDIRPAHKRFSDSTSDADRKQLTASKATSWKKEKKT